MNAGIDWVSLVCFTLGGVVVVSIGQIIDLVRYQWRGVLTTGRVVKLEEEETSEGAVRYSLRSSSTGWMNSGAVSSR
jgi:hypothetical protein